MSLAFLALGGCQPEIRPEVTNPDAPSAAKAETRDAVSAKKEALDSAAIAKCLKKYSIASASDAQALLQSCMVADGLRDASSNAGRGTTIASLGPMNPEKSSRLPGASLNLLDVINPNPVSESGQIKKVEPQLVLGTGVFTRQPRQPPMEGVKAENGDISLNFRDIDVRTVARFVLGKVLNLNYAVHPKAEGSVTVVTRESIPREQLLAAIESVFRLHGFAIVRNNKVYNVVPLTDATRGAPLSVGRSNRSGKGYRVQVVPLRHVPADEMEKILGPLAPKGSVLRVDKARNLLVFAGTGPNIQALLDAVDIFDVDWLAGMSFGLFPIQFADAKVIVNELFTVFGNNAENAAESLIRFVPVERLNAVMVITPQPSYLDRARTWIERLDQTNDRTGERVYVYRVKNADATKLAPLLMDIFGSGHARTSMPSTVTAAAPGGAGLPVEVRGASGGSPPAVKAKATKSEGDRTAGKPRTAADNTSGSHRAATQQPQSAKESRFKIIADADHNSLVIMATPEEYRAVAEALRELDVVPLQVMIEASIISVSLNDELKYGVQWFFDSGDHEINLQFADVIGPAIPGFSYFFNTMSKKFAIDALSEVTSVKILSSPQVLVLDNKTAVLKVGDQVPIATQQSIGSTDDARTVNTIQFRDAGVTLSVTPRVNPGGLVRIEIEQEVSSVKETTTSSIDSPTVDQQKIKSTVVVQSGESVALGGLIRETNGRGRSGLPVLGDIPILGALFSSTSEIADRRELIVILTPRVVGSQEDARAVTKELRRKMDGIGRWFPQLNRKVSGWTKDNDAPEKGKEAR